MKQSMGMMIAQLRKEKGMTQKNLAEQMNVTDKAVSKWERDLACPDINSVPKLAEVLGVSVEELLNASQQEKNKNDTIENVLDIVLKAVPLAMGVAVIVTSVLGKLEMSSAVSMLGVGMVCLALLAFRK